MDDLYNLLGVAPGASPEEIRSAFRRQAKRVHPDAHPGLTPRQRDEHNRRFIGLAQAYETLSDPGHRAAYDRQRAAAQASAAAGHAAASPSEAGPRQAPGAEQTNQSHSAPRPPPTPEQAMNDLAEEVERVLSRFGLDLRQPVEVIMQTLLDWSRMLYRQVSEALGGNSTTTPGAQQGAAEETAQPAGGTRASATGSSGVRQGAAHGEAGGPRPAVGAHAKSSAAPKSSRRKDDKALDDELASLKRRVRSDLAAGRPTGRPPTLEEQLAALKRRLGKE